MSALRGFKAISPTYSGESPEDLARIDVSDVQSTVLVSGNDDADLLIDFDTWRRAPIATQKIYYGQFLHFASRNCVYHRFNVKRLIRMRLVKQLLNALKNWLALVDSAVTLVVFALLAPVHWLSVLVLVPATVLGGYVGGRLARHLPATALRHVVVVFSLAVGIWMALD